MKTFRKNVNGIVLCLFELMIGVILLIKPVGFTSGIIMTAGVWLMLLGLIESVKYFSTNAFEASLGQSLVKGLVALTAGAFCTFQTDWFIATFPVLSAIYGLVILVAGIGKIQITVDMLRLKKQKWYLGALSAAISILSAVIILNNPFDSSEMLWIFIGISLLVEGVCDIITLIESNKNNVEVVNKNEIIVK